MDIKQLIIFYAIVLGIIILVFITPAIIGICDILYKVFLL